MRPPYSHPHDSIYVVFVVREADFSEPPAKVLSSSNSCAIAVVIPKIEKNTEIGPQIRQNVEE